MAMNRRDFVKALLALYLTAQSSAILSGCSDQTGTSGAKPVVLPKKTLKTASANGDTSSSPDLVVVSGGDPEQNTSEALEAFGGMKAFINRGDKVVIKPNILISMEPQYAVTTNPDVIGALVAACIGAGASDVLVIDRPTGGTEEAYRVTGIGPATERAGGRVKILQDRDFVEASISGGLVLKQWPISRDVLDADKFINVPIAKTHGITGLTLGMKNLMGILGGSRGIIHQNIHQKLADLSSAIMPTLTVLDANRILVRNGPSGGSLSDVEEPKTVVIGTDHVLVDAYATSFFGLEPEDIGYIVNAAEMKLGSLDIKSANIKRLRL